MAQAVYDEALRRVLLDLPPKVAAKGLTVDFASPDDLPYRYDPVAGGAHYDQLEITEDVEVATVALADLAQEDVLMTKWSACWPQCPWHDHPPMPRLVRGEAVWICARSDRTVARIGEIAQRRRRRTDR
jgi:hypothetical protein